MVAARRAGYSVAAIDAFLDKQTVASADVALLVEYGCDGFNADAMLAAVNTLDVGQYLGFVYGSGFEAQPELLEKIAESIPLIGNAAATVTSVKTPANFFAALQQHGITYPAVFNVLPVHDCLENIATVYLKKFARGCGGTHITVVSAKNLALSDDWYYQRKITGRSISLLFVAHGRGIEVVGFNEQWVDPFESMPFRYGGAVSNIALSDEIKVKLVDAAEKLTLAFGLVGLNSLDAMVRDGVAYMLEINPRLSATVDLYEDENLLERHVRACIDDLSFEHVPVSKALNPRTESILSKAHAIVYASADVLIASDFDWPVWVVDSPLSNMQVRAGEPICTVIAVADSADEAKQLVHIRVKMLKIEIQNILKGKTCKIR